MPCHFSGGGATDFDSSRAQRNRVMRSAMQRVTAIPCRLGEDIQGDGACGGPGCSGNRFLFGP